MSSVQRTYNFKYKSYLKISKIFYINKKMNFFKKIFFTLFILHVYAGYVSSTNLNPSQQVYITSITYSWDTIGSNEYSLEFSTNNFLTILSSGITSANSFLFTQLKGNTSYYFRVKISTESSYSTSNTLSTVTFTASVSDLCVLKNLYMVSTYAKIMIGFTSINSGDTLYQIDVSTDNSFALNLTTSFFITGTPPFEIEDLKTNTKYYLRVKPFDRNQRPTFFSNIISTTTLAKLPDNIGFEIHITSISLTWTTVNGTDENSSNGYVITVLDEYNRMIDEISISDPNTNTYTISSLSTNTLYTVSFSVLNTDLTRNSDDILLNTLSPLPQNFTLINVSSVTASFTWDEITPHSHLSGYRIEASTSQNFESVISSETSSPSLTSLSVYGLMPNTTYYFRVGSLNLQGMANYSIYINTMTHTFPPDISTVKYYIYPFSIKAEYEKRPPPQNPYGTYGYIFEISTSPYFDGVVYSSYTDSNEVNSLTISGIKPNTIYYARIGTLNGIGVISYCETTSHKTPFPEIELNPYVVSYTSTSITVEYSTSDTDGYEVQLSTEEGFLNISKSTSTLNKSQNTITITSLNTDTRYYIRVGAIFSGATKYFEISQPVTTLTEPPSLTDFKVSITSASAKWLDIPYSSGYYFEASTNSFFSSKIFSYTVYHTETALDITGLMPNTSYYFRVGSINSKGEANYTLIAQTSTLANFPLKTSITNHTTYSMQINFDTNLNPPDTMYLVEISSKNFTEPQTVISSFTFNNYAYFDNLNSNTTYYQRVTAFNRHAIPTGPIYFDPIATLAYKVTDLTHITSTRTVIVNWNDTSNALGTPYLAEISSDNFSTIISSYTLLKSATFYNLNGNTVYQIRVSALNFSSIPSEYQIAITTTRVEIPALKNPSYLNILLDGFTAQWDNNSNSTQTLYIIESSTDSNFIPLFKTSQTYATQLVFGNLSFGTIYYVRIKARGINGEESDYLNLPQVETLYRAEKIIDHTKSSYLSIPFSYGSIEVMIPEYSFGSATRVFIEPLTSVPPPLSNAAELKPTSYAARIYINPKVLITKPITIKIPFSTIPSGFNQSGLVIARYDEDKGLWIPLKSSRYSNYITAETYGFSIFAIMELLPPSTLENVKIYPNPYKPNTNPGYITFSNIEHESVIYIHSISGELIKKLNVPESGMVLWDARNSDGRELASGVYIAVIKSKSGNKIIKKIGIEK